MIWQFLWSQIILMSVAFGPYLAEENPDVFLPPGQLNSSLRLLCTVNVKEWRNIAFHIRYLLKS